jgi:hypothetical protein
MLAISSGHLDSCPRWLGLEPGRKLQPSPRLAFTVLHFIQVAPKKGRGRPATGRDPVTAIRLSAELRATVDKWAAKQDDTPGRSEAIRRLVELGLTVKKRSMPSERQRTALADLAAKAIDSRTVEAPDDERASRKQRLIKGPEEFRGVRVDRPKRK